MKITPLALTLSVGTMLAAPLQAADCVKADCASLGYGTTLPTNCEDYVNCPFDTNYKACIHYKSEYFDSCPAGKTCETKYKVTGSEVACESGYAKKTLDCGLLLYGSYSLSTSVTQASNPDCKLCVQKCTYGVSLSDGSCLKKPSVDLPIEPTTCPAGETSDECSCTNGYQSGSQSGCYKCCTGSERAGACGYCRDGSLTPTECLVGEYTAQQACTMCTYGSLPGSKAGCYKCCTADYTVKTGLACLKCSVVDPGPVPGGL